MRKALVTLFSVGLFGALLGSSCATKQSSGGSGKDNGGAAGDSGGAVSLASGGKGGKSGATGAAGDGTGGTGSVGLGTAGDACPDLTIVSSNGKSCNSTNMSAVYRDIHMLVVLDKSGSMNTTPTGFGASKWDATKQALEAALQSSTDQVHYGLLMFPYSKGTPIPATDCKARCCELPGTTADTINVGIDVASVSVPLIMDQLNGTSPGGGTPTAKALATALDYYTNGAGANLPAGEKYVLLATDGGPNCGTTSSCAPETCTANMDLQQGCGTTIANCCIDSLISTGGGPTLCLDSEAVLTQIKALSDANIKTFVVGIPGTENYKNVLTQLAKAGGVPDPANPDLGYYAVSATDGVAGLTKTFKGITESLVHDCAIKLANVPVDTGMLNVAVECATLQKGATGSENWVYSNDPGTGPLITIQGATCDRIKSTGVKRVDVIEGCTTIVLQ